MTLPHNPDRSTTLHEVAALAGVSTATAARALGDYGSVGAGTRERVLLAAAKLGYRRNELASSLITGRTFSIGLVLGDIENPFFSSIARTIIDAAKSHAYAVLVTNTEESVEAERAAVRVLEEKRVDGMIVAPVLSAELGASGRSRLARHACCYSERHRAQPRCGLHHWRQRHRRGEGGGLSAVHGPSRHCYPRPVVRGARSANAIRDAAKRI